LLNRLVPATILALVVSEIALIASCYVLASYILSDVDPMIWLQYENGFVRIGVLVAGMVFGLYLQDLYSRFTVSNKFLLFQQICLVLGIAFLFQALLSYVVPELLLPKWIMMIGSMMLLIALPLWRILYSSQVTRVLNAERILFLGASDVSRQIARALGERPELGRVVVGFVADEPEAEGLTEGPLLGPVVDFKAIVIEVKPDRVMVGMAERRNRMPVLDLLDVNFAGVHVEDAAVAFESVFGRVCTQQLRPSQLIFSNELGPRPGTMQLQALYSFAFAAAGLLVASPIMMIVAILVKLTSSGPVLYRQRRVGLHGRLFTVFKFRSMRHDAEESTGAVWASRDDPRITPLGRFLRNTRLDEIPQFFNVLKGEMSICGPRPERPEFVATLSEKVPFYRQRHNVRPGITGWAQINHKYGDTVEDTTIKLEYDLYYLKNLAPALDFYILFHTLKIMLLSRGAQ
jgi:sugar transferase (PEP-CTERM system associated)